jgi:hypothetical protein
MVIFHPVVELCSRIRVKSVTPSITRFRSARVRFTAELKVSVRELSEATESVKDTLPRQPPVSAGLLVESTQVVHWG